MSAALTTINNNKRVGEMLATASNCIEVCEGTRSFVLHVSHQFPPSYR